MLIFIILLNLYMEYCFVYTSTILHIKYIHPIHTPIYTLYTTGFVFEYIFECRSNKFKLYINIKPKKAITSTCFVLTKPNFVENIKYIH